MALKKLIEINNAGVEAEYWKIENLQLGVQIGIGRDNIMGGMREFKVVEKVDKPLRVLSGMVQLGGYKNQGKRDDGKDPIDRRTVKLDFTVKELTEELANPYSVAYTKLKDTADFKGSEDV